MSEPPRKVVRSYRLVFHRRWRIQKIQDWRIPLPQGLELRAVGYWLICLAAVAMLGRLPLIGLLAGVLPPSVRFGVIPVLGAAALSRWEVDGRSPHRALAGLVGYRLRPRDLAGLRRCPAIGTELVPLDRIHATPDLAGGRYPGGVVRGPARLLLRYPAGVEFGPQTLRVRALDSPRPLHCGRTLGVEAGARVVFNRRRESGSEQIPSR
jgi:hypothetical protein